jgi:Xaa-Pro dipeptidase
MSSDHSDIAGGMSAAEFRARRMAAARDASERGFSGLVVWSRGGTTADYYGDVLYLTNHHSPFPTVNDSRDAWAARGHSVLVLPADGEPVLLTDYHDDPDDRVAIDDLRVVTHLPRAAAQVVRELELDGGPLGVVGREALSWTWHQSFLDSVGRPLEVVPADEILERLRAVKSEAELAAMRRSAAVGVEWMTTTLEAVAEGRTQGDVVGEGLRLLASRGGSPYDVAISHGDKSGHYFGSSGVPHWNSTRPMRRGDLVHVDQWGPVENYFTDFARSTVVGRRPTDGQRELLEGAVALIDHLIDVIRPGRTFSDLYCSGVAWLDENGFATPGEADAAGQVFATQFPCFGHGLGLAVENPWIVASEHTVLEPNMVVALETVVGRAGVGASNHEHNVVVRDGPPEVLTAGCPDRWWD